MASLVTNLVIRASLVAKSIETNLVVLSVLLLK